MSFRDHVLVGKFGVENCYVLEFVTLGRAPSRFQQCMYSMAPVDRAAFVSKLPFQSTVDATAGRGGV